MPDLDFAFLCDYARAEGGLAHAIAAGIDTVYAETVPTGANFAVLLRTTFTRNECGRPHRIEIIIQDVDGDRVGQLVGTVMPEWKEGLPVGWKVGALLAMNLGLPIQRFGEYEVAIMLGDQQVKSLQFRVVERQPEQAPG